MIWSISMVCAAPLALATAPALGGDDGGGLRFTDVTATSGVAGVVMTSGGTPSTQVLEVKGGGLALIDFDGDGDLDLFMPNGATLADVERGPGARLFRNDSTPEGGIRFTCVTEASGIRHTRWSFGVAVGDVDGDGFDDMYIACYGPDALLRNRGDGTFEDVTAKAGLAAPERAREWGTSCAFADLDGDGDLDLYVVHYLDFDPAKPPAPALFKGMQVLAGPHGMPPRGDRLFLNRGDGTFADVTDASGIGAATASYGLNLAVLDLTGDGRPDIFVANDSQANFLFRNEGVVDYADGSRGPRFVDIGLRSGIATNMDGLEQATMGIAIGDVDGNGRPDVFTTNFSSDTNTLHLNLDGAYFDDRTSQFRLAAPSRPYLGWAAAFVDFDHDGDEDLLVVNGHVYPQASKEAMDSPYEQRPLLLERVGRHFEPRSRAGAWDLEPHRDRTAVFADFDRDGDVDIVIGELNGPLRVIRNDHVAPERPRRDFLAVELRERTGVGNRHAVGAIVEARPAGATEPVQRRWVWGGGPFQSTIGPALHFGFAAPVERVDVVVRWPDGETTARPGVVLPARLVIERAVSPR